MGSEMMAAQPEEVSVAALLHAKADDAIAVVKQLPQADCAVSHHFGPGLYIRELRVPAGVMAIGHWQQEAHMNIMLQGKVAVAKEDGSVDVLAAPLTFVSPPGRKIGYVIEDMIWQNVYATDETDVEALERRFLGRGDEDYARTEDTSEDRRDYLAALEELGVTPEAVVAQSEIKSDLVPFPYGWHKVAVYPSAIAGRGLFATSWVAPGEMIAPARINGKRTPAGRYTNHAKNPNAKMEKVADGVIALVATKTIEGAKGGSTGEEITVDYRQARALAQEVDTCLEW